MNKQQQQQHTRRKKLQIYHTISFHFISTDRSIDRSISKKLKSKTKITSIKNSRIKKNPGAFTTTTTNTIFPEIYFY